MKYEIDVYGGPYSLDIPPEVVRACSGFGGVGADVAAALRNVDGLRAQFENIPADALAGWLDEFGAWSLDDLNDHAANIRRALWIVCGDLREENGGTV